MDLTALGSNLTKPILLCFYAGFLAALLRVQLKAELMSFHKFITFILLLAIGWHGGEEMAKLPLSQLTQVAWLIPLGFLTNLGIGLLAYAILRKLTSLRPVDAATVAGYYGSDSAGTFATCVGFLTALQIGFAPYMPALLTVMELPGCFVALLLVARLERQRHARNSDSALLLMPATEPELVPVMAGAGGNLGMPQAVHGQFQPSSFSSSISVVEEWPKVARTSAGYSDEQSQHGEPAGSFADILKMILREGGVFALMGGMLLGVICQLQNTTAEMDRLFVDGLTPILGLFLMGTGYNAASNIGDLRQGGWRFMLCAIMMPNLFAAIGMAVLFTASLLTGQTLEVGTYVLFAVLCAAASYIAMPAVQASAIPEASPTLPLVASLGLTFTYNVSIGIPLYYTLATVFLQ